MKYKLLSSLIPWIIAAALFAGCTATTPSHSGESGNSADIPDARVPEVASNIAVPLSQPDATQQQLGNSDIAPHFNVWRSVGSILFVLGGLMALHVFLRKRQSFLSHREGQHIRMIERFRIDQKRSLFLLEVDGTPILAAGSLDKLDSITVLGKNQDDAGDSASANDSVSEKAS